jgi:hypothetical protein
MAQTALLLPNYDEYVISYKDRTEAIDKKYLAVILKERNAVFTNSILINGKIEGIWQRAITNNSFTVKTRFFSTLPRTRQQLLAKAITRYGKFLGKSLPR